MKLKSFGLIVALLVLASGLYGCATGEQRIAPPGQRAIIIEQGDNGYCTWEFRRISSSSQHTVVKNSLRILTGPCTIGPESSTLCIGSAANVCSMVRVRDLRGLDFETDGSCRYCYLNSSGGMSCVSYPGNC
jgi:hypothetical protein